MTFNNGVNMGKLDLYGTEQYEELDLLTQLSTPLEHPIYDYAAKIDEYQLDILSYDDIKKFSDRSYCDPYLDVDTIVYKLAGGMPYSYEKILSNCYSLTMEKEGAIDLNTGELNGLVIRFKKIKDIDDSKMFDLMANEAKDALTVRKSTDLSTKELNDVMDILGINDSYKRGSKKARWATVATQVYNIIKDNKWNIYNSDIIEKIPKWIKSYVKKGETASYTNLCRLKIMTHSGVPIYKFEESI